jgi:[protein-PII] uridylyltransferase
MIRDQHRWEKIQNDLSAVLQGTEKIENLMERRQHSLIFAKSSRHLPTRVEIDNEVSNDYTVIDIYAHDKVGLLYLITSSLNQMGLYIGVSKISTKVDQVADVFYVRDIFGHKIFSDEKLEEIRTTLSWAIDDWS